MRARSFGHLPPAAVLLAVVPITACQESEAPSKVPNPPPVWTPGASNSGPPGSAASNPVQVYDAGPPELDFILNGTAGLPDESGAWGWQACGSFTFTEPNETPAAVVGLAVSRDGQRLLATDHRDARLWSLSENFSDSQHLLNLSSGMELSVSLSNDAQLAATSGDGAGVFDTTTGELLFERDLPSGIIASPCVLAQFWVSPSGHYAAGAGYEYAVGVHETDTFSQVAHLPAASCSAAVAFNQAETLMATSEPALYRTRDWTHIWPEADPAIPDAGVTSLGLDDEPWVIEQVQFTPDEQQVVVSKCTIYDACDVAVHSVRSGRASSHYRQEIYPSNHWSTASVSPGGRWLFLGNRVHDRFSNEPARVLDPQLTTGIFIPNGDIIASDAQGTLRRYCRAPL